MVRPKMQIEPFIQNVDPGTHWLDPGYRACMDLNHPLVTDKHHDRGLLLSREVKQFLSRVHGHAFRKTPLRKAHSLLPSDTMFAQQREEFVDILEASPSCQQTYRVDLGVRLVCLFRQNDD